MECRVCLDRLLARVSTTPWTGQEIATTAFWTGFIRPFPPGFASNLADPTPAQRLGWPAIASGQHTLIVAPTGSGKTLAAFLAALDHIWRANRAEIEIENAREIQERADPLRFTAEGTQSRRLAEPPVSAGRHSRQIGGDRVAACPRCGSPFAAVTRRPTNEPRSFANRRTS